MEFRARSCQIQIETTRGYIASQLGSNAGLFLMCVLKLLNILDMLNKLVSSSFSN